MSNIPQGCKPFNLQEALAGNPVVTRDGRKVKIAGYNPDAKNNEMVIGWVDNVVETWSIEGIYDSMVASNYDLFMAAETKDVWVVLWRIKGRDHISSVAFEEEDSAGKFSVTVREERHFFHGINKITITV